MHGRGPDLSIRVDGAQRNAVDTMLAEEAFRAGDQPTPRVGPASASPGVVAAAIFLIDRLDHLIQY